MFVVKIGAPQSFKPAGRKHKAAVSPEAVCVCGWWVVGVGGGG